MTGQRKWKRLACRHDKHQRRLELTISLPSCPVPAGSGSSVTVASAFLCPQRLAVTLVSVPSRHLSPPLPQPTAHPPSAWEPGNPVKGPLRDPRGSIGKKVLVSSYAHPEEGDPPGRRKNPAGGHFSVLFYQVTASSSGSSPAAPSSAASLEALQCEGPVRTGGSGCHPEDDLRGSGVDFQAKGYVFSQPFHLIVSYGESWAALTGAGLLFHSPASPFNPHFPQEGTPQDIALDDIPPPTSSAHRAGYSRS